MNYDLNISLRRSVVLVHLKVFITKFLPSLAHLFRTDSFSIRWSCFWKYFGGGTGVAKSETKIKEQNTGTHHYTSLKIQGNPLAFQSKSNNKHWKQHWKNQNLSLARRWEMVKFKVRLVGS